MAGPGSSSHEGDCDANLFPMTPDKGCAGPAARGWSGMHTLPRVLSLADYTDWPLAGVAAGALPGAGAPALYLAYTPLPALATLRGCNYTAPAPFSLAAGEVRALPFQGTSFEVELRLSVNETAAGEDGAGWDVGIRVLSSLGAGGEYTRVGLRSARRLAGMELVNLNQV